MNDALDVSRCLVECCAVSCMRLLKGYSGRLTSCRSTSITSHAISEAEQDTGEYLHHHICRQFGTTMLISSNYLVDTKDRRAYPKFHVSC